MMTDDEASLRFNDNPTQSGTDLTQTSNSVEISFPAILLTLLSPQLLAVFPDPDFKWPLRMLSISLLIRLAQAMAACSVLRLLVLLVVLLLPCSDIMVLLSVSWVSVFVLLVLIILERVWLLWFNTVVVVVIVVVVVVDDPATPLALVMLVRLLELNNVLGIIGGFMGRSWVWFLILVFWISVRYNRIRDEYESTTNHNMKVNKIQNKRIYGYQLAISTWSMTKLDVLGKQAGRQLSTRQLIHTRFNWGKLTSTQASGQFPHRFLLQGSACKIQITIYSLRSLHNPLKTHLVWCLQCYRHRCRPMLRQCPVWCPQWNRWQSGQNAVPPHLNKS